MDKHKVMATLEQLPNEFSTEELIEKLLFFEKVERGLKDVADGKLISLEDAKHQFKTKWSK
jgi:uncharacterized protein YktA (UPF0223 family)